ncbi:pyridoxal-phosphate dependent enzyme [bacterium]|nr:pyridoxal-phosphate dependent enzyme [bacterium]
MTRIACTKCNKPFPSNRIPFHCECGGSFDYAEFPDYDASQIDQSKFGMMKYASLFGLEKDCQWVSLGEGNTPLLPTTIEGHQVFCKMESHNPTGSYKDRGSAVLVSFLKSRGVDFAVEDSSGNAGASFAGYCAMAGVKARVYVPESASGPKRMQIERYGADLIRVPGPRSEAAKAVLEAANTGVVYASHAWMPFGLTGIASIAYELVEQLGGVPGTVVAPVGHGGLLYGIMRGFESMAKAGAIPHEPDYVGVQSNGCAPVTTAFIRNTSEITEVPLSETAAEGVKVALPARGGAIVEKLLVGKGCMVSINEEQLLDSWRESARQGFYMEPTSALVWAAIKQNGKDFKTPVVAVITGSGYKSTI